jgi:hypothetical protein
LVNDIIAMYPSGKLPPVDKITMRKPEEIEDVMKKPFEKGWRHIYTIAYPP